MKQVGYVLIILFLASCASVSIKKIDKVFEKENEPEVILQSMKAFYHNEKAEKNEKIHIIKKLKTIKNPKINQFFLAEFESESDEDIQTELIEALLEQENEDNIQVFIQEIENNNPKTEELKDQIVSFGKAYFHRWQAVLTTDDSVFKKKLMDMVEEMDRSVIKEITHQYIKQKDHSRESLVAYLLIDKSETAKQIAAAIIDNEVTTYNQIEMVVNQIGDRYLRDYQMLFTEPFTSETSKNIAKSIFLSFQNNCILALDLHIYPITEKLGKKEIIFEILHELNTTQSLNTLIKMLMNSSDSFEQEKIITLVSDLTNQIPTEYMKLMENSNIAHAVLATLPAYIEKNADAVRETFMIASDFAKVKMLNYLLRNNYDAFLSTLLPHLYHAIPYLREFTVITLYQLQRYDPIYQELIQKMVSSNNVAEFKVAFQYALQQSQYFQSYVFDQYQVLSQQHQKNYYLPTMLIKSDSTTCEELLFDKYISHFQQSESDIAAIYAHSIYQKENVDQTIFQDFCTQVETDSLYSAFAFLLANYEKNDWFNFIATNWIVNNYFQFELADRLKIIKYVADSANSTAAVYLISSYEQLTLIEKNYVNGIITNFPMHIISNHLEKLIYLGDDEQFNHVADFLTYTHSQETIPKSLAYALASRYFIENDFTNFLTFSQDVDTSTYPQYLIQSQISELYAKKGDFEERFKQEYKQKPNNLLMNGKILCDSLVVYNFMLKSPLLMHLNKQKVANQIDFYKSQLALYQQEFDRIFQLFDLNEDDFNQGDFSVSIAETLYLKELKCGNITFSAQSDSVYFYVLVEIKNNAEKAVHFIRDAITLKTDSNRYRVSYDGDYYEQFNEKSLARFCLIPANTSIFYPLYFKVHVTENEYKLTFENDDLFQLFMPIHIEKSFEIE